MKRLGSKLILGGEGGKGKKIELIMGNSKVYSDNHKTTAID